MTDLSVIIPARNEEFLNRTIDEVLTKSEMDTEVIVICDGALPIEPIPDNDRVTIILHNESVGQRASCNEGAKISQAKHIMKLDAHCKLAQGYDRVLIENHQPNWVQVPRMYNLHAFDWVCEDGHKRYQGPSGECRECGKPTKKKMIWQERLSRKSDFMRFDENLKFGYWGSFGKRPEAKGDLAPTMSILGACWFLTREYYWELDGMDEEHGSWGQMGTEIACKTWLYGGALMVNKKTWFSHMFRTQGGDFGFPYPLSGNQVNKARKHSQDMWRNNKWPKAKYDFQWLIDKFAPIPGWSEPGKEIIFYTDNKVPLKIAHRVQNRLAGLDIPIVSASLKPMPHFGDNIYLPLERGYLTMFIQILMALKKTKEEIIYFCEHDVLYDPSHFTFTPPRRDTFYYNTNVWKVDWETGKSVRTDDCRQTSGLVAYRDLLIDHYEKRLKYIENHGFSRKMGFEPGTHGRIPAIEGKSETFESDLPNYDLRHGQNLTETRWSPSQFRNKKYTEGWQEKTIDLTQI